MDCHCAHIFKSIFFNENHCSLVQISMKFVPVSVIDNKSALVQVMAWGWTGDKPLSELIITKFNDTCTHHKASHIETETKWPPFRRRHFQVHFLECKLLNFKSNFTEIWSLLSNWRYDSIGSDNGLVPNRRRAIIWSNVCMLYWCIYVSLNKIMRSHDCPARRDNTFRSLTPTIHKQSCLIP